MKTFNSILVCSALALLVGCGGSDSSVDSSATKPKPMNAAPIPDGPKSSIGLTSSDVAPPGTAPATKKKN
jgi:hypothetical protein